MEIHAGKLRHRLEIQEPKDTQKPNGEKVAGWATVAKRWGAIEALDGTERFIAKQAQAMVSHRITIRWLDGLTPRHRILFDGRVFSITSILNSEELNFAQTLMAWELI